MKASIPSRSLNSAGKLSRLTGTTKTRLTKKKRGLPHRPPPVQLGVVGGEHLVSIGMVVVSTAMATVELGVVGSEHLVSI